jgi:hypothetical protein
MKPRNSISSPNAAEPGHRDQPVKVLRQVAADGLQERRNRRRLEVQQRQQELGHKARGDLADEIAAQDEQEGPYRPLRTREPKPGPAPAAPPQEPTRQQDQRGDLGRGDDAAEQIELGDMPAGIEAQRQHRRRAEHHQFDGGLRRRARTGGIRRCLGHPDASHRQIGMRMISW